MSSPGNERIAEVRDLVHRHLTAAMLMVSLEAPLDPEMSVGSALEYLDEKSFDLALLRTKEVRIAYRDRLAQVSAERKLDPVKARADSPRADRLIEHSLELGEVARRLKEDSVPLLVVGRNGPEHIVTVADFTRPAGQAGVLAVLAALDGQLDELLRPFDEEAWTRLDAERRAEIDGFVQRATARSEDVHRLAYLSMRERFELLRTLKIGERRGLNLGSQAEHELITGVRNDLAHGRKVPEGHQVIDALELAERVLDETTKGPEAGGPG